MFAYYFNDNDILRINLKKEKDFFYYNAGEIFEPELKINEIYKKIMRNETSDFLGEYNYFFEDDENIYVLTDELGSIKWFYYKDKNKFFLSNNYWYIVNELRLGKKDIEISSFYESVLFYSPLNNKTFFKNLFVVPRGSILIFSKKNRKLTIKEVKSIVYKEKKISKTEWFEKIDNAFENMMNKIRSFNKDLYLALTISGGLDSRFSLFYLHNISKKFAYLLGLKKKLFEPLDYKSAKKLANFFNLKLLLINPFKNISMKEKLLIDIARNPIGPSNVLKVIDKRKSFNRKYQFNVLLTGSYGSLIGGRILNDDLINSNKDEILKKIFIYYSSYKSLKNLQNGHALKNFFRDKIKKILILFRIIENKKINVEKEIEIFLNDDFLIPQNERNKILNTFNKFFVNIKKRDNLTLIMNFHLFRHSIRGSFESLHGQVKSYSIYYPYIYELSKNWNLEYLKGRKLMEEFLLWKNPEVAKIQLQSIEPPINLKFSRLSKGLEIFFKLKSLGSFVINGLVINYNQWWKKKEVQKFYNEIKQLDSKLFDEIFNKQDIEQLYKYSRYDLIIEHILKLKYILIAIENQKYDQFLNLNILETEKY